MRITFGGVQEQSRLCQIIEGRLFQNLLGLTVKKQENILTINLLQQRLHRYEKSTNEPDAYNHITFQEQHMTKKTP